MHEISQTVGFQMSLLLFVSLSGYLVASISKQSAVICQIIMGLIVGPSLLGILNYSGLVVELAHLGAVILLFVVGLEFKLKDLMKIPSFAIALSGVLLPWLTGYALSLLFGYDFLSCLFIATAMTATSIAITANVLYELGYIKSDMANTIIGAAVIDDILALLALTITVQLSTGTLVIIDIAYLTLKAIIFLMAGIVIGYFVIRKIIFKADRSQIAKNYPEFVFVLAITLAFLYALCAVAVGLSDIIGAFVAGVVLEGISLKHSRHFHDGADYLRIIFASIFFVSLGVLADISVMSTTVMIFSIVLTLAAVLSKLIGCGLVARLFKYTWLESSIIGVCMSPRGEVAMVVALLALKEKVIEQDVYLALMIMSVMTTIIAPVVLRRLLSVSKNKILTPKII